MTPSKNGPTPPISPGKVLNRILKGEITQGRLAKAMRVSRYSINQIINGHRNITAKMALRLAHVTSTMPNFWLNLQRDVDLYYANKKMAGALRQLQILRPPKSRRKLFSKAIEN